MKDPGIAKLAGVKTLRELNLSDARFTDKGLAQLATLPNLERLSVTRVRLTEKGLVARDRGAKDRRHSVTRITREGIKLLDRIDPEMNDAFAPMESRLTLRDARELSRLCEAIYEGS